MPIHEHHDKVAKRLLRDACMMADALRLCLPSEMLNEIDLGTLRLLPTEHMDAELRRRSGNLIWTAGLKGGGAVAIPVEAQSTPDPTTAIRMMTLTGMLHECTATTLKELNDGPLAVLPIVLHTGLHPWTAARDLAELVEPLPGLEHFFASPHYLLIDVRALATRDLPRRNRMAVLVRLKTARSPEALLEALRDALMWLGDDEIGSAFEQWVSEALMPLQFPDADRPLKPSAELAVTEPR